MKKNGAKFKKQKSLKNRKQYQNLNVYFYRKLKLRRWITYKHIKGA